MARPNGFVLDTNILIALIRDNDLGKYIDRTYQLTFGTAAFYLPIVTHGEAHSLALQWHRYYAKRATLDSLLDTILPLDIAYSDMIAAYAMLDHASHTIGINMGKNDLWIAALAHVHDLTLLTTDRDFDHLIAANLIDGVWIDPKSK